MLTVLRLGIFGLVLLLSGCAARPPEQPGSSETWWINSFRVPCVGVAPMQCLQVHRETQPLGPWQLFYSEIVGFDFEPGRLTRVRVRLVPLPLDRVPADGSSIRYELMEILERVPDPRNGLHDIFVLVALSGPLPDESGPVLGQTWIEFNIVQARYAGQDGCGAFEGDILRVDGERLEISPIRERSGACTEDPAATAFRERLTSVRTWKRDALRLSLADAAGAVSLEFRKVD